MADITQLYKTPPHGDGGMETYKKKLLRHRAGLGIRFLICAVAVLVIIVGVWLWFRGRTYTEYEVLSSVEHSSAVNTQYAEYNDYLLRYNRDGISCVNTKNEAVWSQTYNMQYPILDTCGNAAAVADRQGNEVYVFDSRGLLTQITTRLPIQQISVSSQGVTALLLNDSNVSWIYLYDAEGNVLAESRCSLEETGQPLSISISRDGSKLAVSYLQIQNGTAGSCIVFYNFGSVGANFVDKIVSSTVYEDMIIPRVKYLGSSVCVAVSDQGIICYEGAEIPEETSVLSLDAEILSVFFGTDTVGIITEEEQNPAEEEETPAQKTPEETSESTESTENADAEEGAEEETGEDTMEQNQERKDAAETAENTDKKKTEKQTDRQKTEADEEEGRYQVNLYDTNGRTVLSLRTDLKYTQAKISKDMLILYNDTECEIYSPQGVLKYAGSFDTAIADLYKTSGFRRYVAVFSDRTDIIKLK